MSTADASRPPDAPRPGGLPILEALIVTFIVATITLVISAP
jgi:hypothetical protein